MAGSEPDTSGEKFKAEITEQKRTIMRERLAEFKREERQERQEQLRKEGRKRGKTRTTTSTSNTSL